MSTTELFERRRENLSKIIDQWIASQRFKTGKEICEYYGLSAAHVAQLLNSKRQIGEKAARELEQQLGLEALILDQPELQIQQVQNIPVPNLYGMRVVEQELFRLKPIDAAHYQIEPTIQLQPNHYAIQVSSEVYAPILKSGWWLLCDRQRQAQPADLLCVQLINELCLILELQAETEQELHCQSLEGKRQVSFRKQDIQQAGVVIAILYPEQIQLT
ncbi:hypothetical protein BS636_02500 [Acinetobacter sp. LoGeW2-3]|uniref:hypothetical protein n=1 Tax=Acinetobacter sp. LoGeW2-3 TaxID=1808001 RepID=UPI000C05A2A4|nr:hypothetical protein [Acinetobacter sp. LoGeW2-3]ATO18611.1 hypothetical protein BS636_02500 [Acinetobacter sp. LoGeW2-3]